MDTGAITSLQCVTAWRQLGMARRLCLQASVATHNARMLSSRWPEPPRSSIIISKRRAQSCIAALRHGSKAAPSILPSSAQCACALRGVRRRIAVCSAAALLARPSSLDPALSSQPQNPAHTRGVATLQGLKKVSFKAPLACFYGGTAK